MLMAVAAAAIAVALRVTPLQTVSVAGQVFKVGATAPDLDPSGPGEVDLFGQSLPTTLTFSGPVRPRLQLAEITINSELTTFVEGAKPTGLEHVLGQRLAQGWIHYFAWETALAGVGALLLVGALAGWRRIPHRTTFKLLAAGLVVTEAINVGAIMTAAHGAAALGQIRSFSQLVGSAPPQPLARPKGRPLPGVQALVIGDSTAAGAGLSPVADGSHADRTCGRSADSYAFDLAAANDWKILNIACNSATISEGILGPQIHHGHRLAPQIQVAQRVPNAAVVIVSVGADDLDWATMVAVCAVAPRCDDRATTAYFQQQLASFSKDYLELLGRLAALPGHPAVIVNRYYNPFDPDLGCLRAAGLTQAKLRTLTARLNTLNAVLAEGAAQFGFTSPLPDFAGHQLCTSQPYVQGLNSAAPFHPTTSGELAIALADQAVLRGQQAVLRGQEQQPARTGPASG
jgi:GDSL-like lipase/acylhydrolase family protein